MVMVVVIEIIVVVVVVIIMTSLLTRRGHRLRGVVVAHSKGSRVWVIWR